MPRFPRFVAVASFLVVSIARPALAAWPHALGSPVAIAPGVNDEYTSSGATIPDGAGGFFVAFSVSPGPTSQLFLQRVTSAGATAPGWPAGGVVMSAPGSQGDIFLVPDGAGGVMAVWLDGRSGTHFDVYAQRVTSAGAIQAGWAAGGVAVATQPVDKPSLSVCTDGAGGAFAAYSYVFGAGDLDVYAAHVLGNATVSTVVVNGASQIQENPAVSADGAGGFYVAFEDNTAGNYDLKASRYNSSLVAYFTNKIICDEAHDQQYPQIVTSGSEAVVYWADQRNVSYSQMFYDYVTSSGSVGYDLGFPFYSTAYSQGQFTLTPDNSGGYYVSWIDARPSATGLYLKHILNGSIAYPGWPAGGVFLGPGSIYQNWYATVAVDPDNGAVVAWTDQQNFSGALLAAHFDTGGNARPLTQAGGTLFMVDGDGGSYLTAATDGSGGAFVTFMDPITGHNQVCAQHIDQFLTLGDARPSSAGVKDIKADQGGHVRLTWNASWLDNPQSYGIGSYWIWRQSPITLAMAAKRSGSTALFRPAADATAGYAWEFLAQQPANQSAQYSFVAPTASDSVTGHNPYTVFMIEAHAAGDSRAFWQSVPDSGYSVDNLAPATPAPFLGTYASGNTTMSWGPNSESDLGGYRLYRGTTLGFVPSPGNLVATVSGTGYLDPGVPPSIYKLTAIDVHGNESPPATLVPQGVTAVDADLPRELSFALASANPSRSGASLRLALPRSSGVSVAVYDVSGRRVRALAEGSLAAGVHTLTWDGRNAAGEPAPSGVYLARMSVDNRNFVARIVLAR